MKRGDAGVSRLKELACIAVCMSKRFVRLAHVFEVNSQAVEEFERGEFPIYRHHGASGCFTVGDIISLQHETARTLAHMFLSGHRHRARVTTPILARSRCIPPKPPL